MPRQHTAGQEYELYEAASPKKRKEILGNKILPLIELLEPELANPIMNYLLPMSNIDLISMVKEPAELVIKVWDLMNKSHDRTHHFLQVEEAVTVLKARMAK